MVFDCREQGQARNESKSLFKVARTIACVYLSVSIPLRIAFLPDFQIDGNTFSILDFFSMALYVMDALRNYYCDRHLWMGAAQISPVWTDAGGRQSTHRSTGMVAESLGAGMPKTMPTWKRPILSLVTSTVACLPIEYITLLQQYNGVNGLVNYLMLNRILIILRLPKYIEDLADFFEAHGLKSIGVQRAWKLFFAMALAGHWCCCGFFLAGKMEAIKGGDLTWPENLDLFQIHAVNDAGDERGSNAVRLYITVDDVLNAYIQSLYWAYITMITTGFGDITPLAVPETVWCIFSMSLGVIITTCAIANLQLLVTNADAAFAEYQHRIETITKYMKYRKLPNDLQNRIMEFYRYQWDLLKGADEVKFLDELPSSIQQQVANFMCRDLIASLPLLREANLSLLNALADCVEINIYSPNDEILKRGDIIRGAILVSRGEVEVLSGLTVVRKMRRLDYFAAESLFSKDKSDKTIRGRTFSEIFLLPSSEFQDIIRSQCDKEIVDKMKERANLGARNAKKVNKLFGSADDHLPSNGFQLIFFPNNKFRYSWDLIALLGYTFYYFSLPLMVMRYLEAGNFSDHLASFSVSYLWDIYFAVDLYLSFSRFMYFEEGLIVFDRDCIRRRFFRDHNSIAEIVAILPIDLFGVVNPRWCFILRLSKLVRLPRILTSMQKLERMMADFKLEKGLVLLKIGKLNIALVILCHWIGCLWHSCANVSLKFGFETNWIQQDEVDNTLSIDHDALNGNGAYLRSIYWAIVASTTVGYGDIIPTNIVETTFATVVILFGGLMLPAIVGGLAAYLGNIGLAQRKFRKKIFRIKQYMRQRSMDRRLIEKVVNYYHYLWSRQGDMDEEESCLDELPLTLRKEVSAHINRNHINAAPFLNGLENSMKDALGLSLKSRIFVPMDNIMNYGEIGSSMYFMEKGEAAVIGKDGLVLCILRRGHYFGERALLSANFSSTVKALTYCDVFELSREDFQQICDTNLPLQSHESLNAAIQNLLQETRIMNTNIMRNFKHRPKCCTRVSRDFFPLLSNQMGSTSTSNIAPRTLYSPDSTFRAIWSIVVVLAIIFNLWMVPYRIAFPTSGNIQASRWFDWVPDILLVLDMYLNSFRFAFYQDGGLIFDSKEVQSHYLSSRFKLDLISILPYELIYVLASHQNVKMSTLALLKIPRMFWVVRLPKNLNNVFRHLEDRDVNLSSLKLVEFLSGVIMIAHLASCGFIIVARSKSDRVVCDMPRMGFAGCEWKGTWIERQIQNIKLPNDGGNSLQQYLRALNWALPTLVVVVIGDVVPVNMNETLYAFLWMIVGVSLNAAIIGNVANIVANIDEDSLCFAKKADDLKRYIKKHQVSPRLLRRIDLFISEVWDHNADVNGDTFLEDLPKSLQIEVTERTRYWHISHCPFFDFCSLEIVKALSLRLRLLLFSSNDAIVSFGDNGVDMFFLERGTVEVMSADYKTTFATLSAESNCEYSARPSVFFGETSLFFKRRRTGTVRCVTFCEVYRLRKDDLDTELGLGLGRDFDLSRMLNIFTSIADSNEKRNKAVTRNLNICRTPNSKLAKLIDPDSRIDSSKKVPNIFKPASSFRICWDALCVLLVLYIALERPYRAVFLYLDDEDILRPWMVVDFVIEVFFVIELYLRLYLFPITQNGAIVTDSGMIRKDYAQHELLMDTIISFPVGFLAYLFKQEYFVYIRLFHMVRILRLPQYLARIEGYLNLANLRISAATRLLSRVFGYYFLVIHWFGCIWFAIHRFLELSVQFTWATTDCPHGNELGSSGCLSSWLENLGKHDICYGTIRRCYIRAVYFVLTTMSTVGYGDISPVTELETIFQNIVVLTGACFFAGIIGSFGEFFSQNDESGTSAFKTKLQKLQEYMKYRQLPQSLQDEILFYHRSRWDRSHVIEEEEVTSMLSEPLQMELSSEMLSDVIHKFPILRECSTILIKRISHALILQMCPRNTSIYHAGDIGWDIYFIESGLVRMELPKDLSILDEEGRANMRKTKEKADAVGLIYRPGNHFGESCLGSISGVRRESTIATTVVELYLLSKESLDNIFRYTPQEERECLKRKLLTRNGNVWHSFDETETESPMETQSFRRSKVAKSPTSFLSWTRPQRFTLTQSASTSFSSSSSSSSLRSTRRRQYRNSRLRSFSAQASTQVLRLSTTNVETSSNRESLAVLHEHTTSTPDADAENLETLDAIEAARMIQNGHVIIDALESESESTCSSYQNSVIASTCSDTG